MHLLSDQASNAKLSKNSIVSASWNSSILYLSPADSSGLTDSQGLGVNLCPAASPGCKAACLNTAGRGAMNSVQAGRLRKAKLFVENRPEFMRQLVADLETLARRQFRTGITQAVRLNGTSDIAWESIPAECSGILYPNVMRAFPNLTFYDYTKLPMRAMDARAGGDPDWPENYYLTFSRSEVNHRIAERLAIAHVNVAVVFAGTQLPRSYYGRPVIDGTEHDMRFLDPNSVIVGLLAKGQAKHDESGFVVSVELPIAKGA